MADYPGYDEDPKVKKVIDRCRKIPTVSLRKQRRNAGYDSDFYNIRTLRAKLCTKRASEGYDVYPRYPGLVVNKNAVHTRQKGGSAWYYTAGELANIETMLAQSNADHGNENQIQIGGMGLGALNDPVLRSYLSATQQKLKSSTLIPLGIILTLLYAYYGGTAILDHITDWVWDGEQILVPIYHLMS